MSEYGSGGARLQQVGSQPVAPYSLISLLDKVALSDDGADSSEVRITCVDFWS